MYFEYGVQVVLNDDQKKASHQENQQDRLGSTRGELLYFDGFSIQFSSLRVGARRRQAKVLRLPVATSRCRLPCTPD